MGDRTSGPDPAQELDAIAAALSHDLRAPLRAIDGFSRILLAGEDSGLADDTRRFLALVRDAGGELAELLDDLVDLIRVGHAEPAFQDDVDPARLARELVDAVLAPRAATMPGRDAVVWAIEDVPPCRADPALLRRLLEELLDNALKFGGGGRVSLTWDAAAERTVAVYDSLLTRGVGLVGNAE